MKAIAAKIAERQAELAKMEVLDNGKAIAEASTDIGDVSACFEYYAERAIELDQKQDQEIKLPDDSFSCRVR